MSESIDPFFYLDGDPPDAGLPDLREFLLRRRDYDGLPTLKPPQWAALKALYPVERKAEVYAAIADHLLEHKVPFPRPVTTDGVAQTAFGQLKAKPWEEILGSRDLKAYTARQSYRHWGEDSVRGVISLGAPYNEVSDHFQWQNRLRCRGWNSKSPMEMWENPHDVDWIFYSFPEDRERLGVTRDDYVGTFRLRTYTATQFRPQVAKAFFGWTGAGTVFDISCGWGDRLAGFYASGASKYVGCDPNRAVWEAYQRQCLAYENWLGWTQTPTLDFLTVGGYDAFRVRGHKEVLIVNGPAEDMDWSAEGPADLVFASPPYFAVEKYAEDQGAAATATQSWSRYPQFDAWRDKFLFPVVDKVTAALRPGGALALNMADPTIRGTRHEACDPLVDRLLTQGMIYEGVVAMALKKRPSTEKGKKAVTMHYAEPVWLLRTDGPPLPPITVEIPGR